VIAELVFHWLSLVEHHRADRPHEFPGLRDPAAFFEVMAALVARGYRAGRAIYTYPLRLRELQALQQQHRLGRLQLPPLDLGFLGPGHLIVVPTRIPLSDFVFDLKRMLRPPLNLLNARIMALGWLYFEYLARSSSRLTAPVASLLRPGYENRAMIQFQQNKGALAVKCWRLDGGGGQKFGAKQARTMGWVLYLKDVPSLLGADLLVFWGMGGVETLALAHHLRTGLGHLLDAPGFTMIEFERAVRPDHPGDVGFASDWRPEIILRCEPLPLDGLLSPEAAVARVLGERPLVVAPPDPREIKRRAG
jgi:hypothetical protein